MRTFKDIETGYFWQFGDDVTILETETGWQFVGKGGISLERIPHSLVPAKMPGVTLDVSLPLIISRYQGREAMRLTPYGDGGASLFDACVALLEREDTPAYYRRAWEELQVFDSTSPMLNAVADELGVTQAQRSDLFLFGAMLRA